MKKLFFVLVLTLVSALILVGGAKESRAASSESGKVIELQFAYWPPPPAPICRVGFEGWGPAVESATNGRVKIKYFGGSALGAPPAHYDLATSGTADIAVMTPEFTPGAFPLSCIANLPALFSSSEIAATSLYQYHQKYTVGTELKKVKLLAVSPTSPHQLHMIKKQIKTLEELKGLKLACTSVAHAKTIEALGAVPVKMVEGEVFTALERGMVDGRLHAWDSIVTHKTMEVTKYRTGNVNAPLNQMMLVMNLNSWKKLPPDIQNIMTGLSGLFLSRHLGMVFDRANAQMLEIAKQYDKKKGNPDIYWLPEKEQEKWRAAMESYPAEWAKEMEAKGLPGKAALADLRSYVKNNTKLYK